MTTITQRSHAARSTRRLKATVTYWAARSLEAWERGDAGMLSVCAARAARAELAFDAAWRA
jgi:hypothetical protein